MLLHANAVFSELGGSPNWAASLSGSLVQPTPLFVKNLPEPGVATMRRRPLPDYAIVPVARGVAIKARFALHADTGRFLEAEGVKHASDDLPAYKNVQQMVIAAGGSVADAEWVWAPCRQSTTRFLPFFRFQVNGVYRYIRADGPIYDVLDTSGQG